MYFLRIRVQLVALAVVCATPGAIGLGLYAYNDRAAAVDAAQSRSYAIAKRVASSMDGGFREYDYLLSQLAGRPRTRELNSNRCDPLLLDLPSLRPELTALTVRDLDSNLICSSLAHPTSKLDAKEAELARKGVLMASMRVVSIARGEVSGRLVARMTYPVRNATGVISGELLAPLDLLTYGERILSDLPDNVRVVVVDRAGAILMRSRSARSWEGRPVPTELWKVDDRQEAMVQTRDAEGGKRIGAYVTVTETGWVVSSSLSETEVLAPHRTAALVATIAAMSCFAVAILGARVIGRSIAQPVERLIDVSERFAQGGTSARASESGPREIRELTRRLNALLDHFESRA
ncbi:hypothetical protein R69746_08459 [Paraburkholderia aspalathi]|uniref:cache domain-containing protein n=1 Tax=Paraburkholderia aspalathi TaxID=1324617 RepID=UPI00190D1DB7|nr:cache and HAMP domain-containing protein [Paraburkholderia aspalathi]MBK3844360.1 HAMP domain-containing protein [Paraburkholderia aspalathi]CAE6840856.1 hypothetical protein R75465_06709 [Paraburkholderia aspalathi]CAE6871412.1 hypothetical protein R69746_08459 [Paraburkholderia aspalathi]